MEKIRILLRGTAIALEARNAEASVEAIGKEANLEDERIDFQQREKEAFCECYLRIGKECKEQQILQIFARESLSQG